MPLNKTCSMCKEEKSLDEFWKDKMHKDGRKSACKDCLRPINAKRSLEYARKNSAKVRESQRRSREKRLQRDPDYIRERDLQRFYGIGVADYDHLLDLQAGVCAICGNPPKARRLAVDHNSKTGEIRGLLCVRCNTAIGLMAHDILLFETAIRYISND